jgi:hypothetical protein
MDSSDEPILVKIIAGWYFRFFNGLILQNLTASNSLNALGCLDICLLRSRDIGREGVMLAKKIRQSDLWPVRYLTSRGRALDFMYTLRTKNFSYWSKAKSYFKNDVKLNLSLNADVALWEPFEAGNHNFQKNDPRFMLL